MTRTNTTEITNSLVLVAKSANSFDNRYVSKAFRDLGALRRRLTAPALAAVVARTYPVGATKTYLAAVVGEGDVDMEAEEASEPLPEVDAYVHLLVQLYLLDTGALAALDAFNVHVVAQLRAHNRRTLDLIAAKIWFYVARTYELRRDFVSVRPALQTALRTATLRHDDETRAALITLLLRNYLLTHDVEQAANLVGKLEFPEALASNALVARYFYYLARIHAVQLDYSRAHEYVTAAMRKAPQSVQTVGFQQAATKLNVVIELLMGDIPEARTFTADAALERSLAPYLTVTRAVRLGDLQLFEECVAQHAATFQRDATHNLVMRLRQNVIKTGIRIISLSYSKISLRDICIKLQLDSEESTEYIVAKAIRDGVIDATIDVQGFMASKEIVDVYATTQPQAAFDARIKFCNLVHNDMVKAMRYPTSTNRVDLKAHLEASDKESQLLKALQDGDLDDGFF
ncbi:hypothetical protein BABINDRAFT_37283 [Babjeviella inositovora NRRL Y-12698]|uniref:PCI domain-containing protein n=1 Tax=Babjeviella inositovora NRRL Y-12698 TaxID=984486 RepID=A0A1E3QP99_9ASCO|nr:uncharacterized protein BABINDRAFT_37283 [Babjeviella inositovora NRRL Y-12698]ODQ79536.1 hypothetical protein BABINDRAFT_37283 [Babjeviella inositovora NRRL Y-12698]